VKRNETLAYIDRVDGTSRHTDAQSTSGLVRWRSWGNKPIHVVLIPGGFGSWRHWIANVEALSAHCTVHCVEPLGFGDSSDPRTQPPELGELAQTIVETVPMAKGAQVALHFVGFSFGGIIAGAVAAMMGSQCASLTVCGSGALGLPTGTLAQAHSVAPNQPRDVLYAAYRHNLAHFMLKPAHVSELAVELEHESVLRSRLRYGHILRSTALHESIAQLRCPVGAIWGDDDPFTHGCQNAYRKYFEALPTYIGFEVIKDAAHWVMFEQPERYNRALLALLARAMPNLH
jgi:2-hydroxy-6-oxonona-2,4-dienedioate hydrolase